MRATNCASELASKKRESVSAGAASSTESAGCGRTSKPRTIKSAAILLAPHCQLVAIGISEVEATSAGKVEGLAHNPAAGGFHLRIRFLQFRAVDDHQHSPRTCFVCAGGL